MVFLNTISLPLARPEGWDILPSFPSNLVTLNEPVKFIPPTVTGFMWCPECPPRPKSSFLTFRTRENLRSSSPAYFIKIGKTTSGQFPAEMVLPAEKRSKVNWACRRILLTLLESDINFAPGSLPGCFGCIRFPMFPPTAPRESILLGHPGDRTKI